MKDSDEQNIRDRKKRAAISKETLRVALHEVNEPGQVIIHCSVVGREKDIIEIAGGGKVSGTMIRITKTTILKANDSDHKSELIHFESIALDPELTFIPSGLTHEFTVIFSSLPRNCNSFNLMDMVPDPKGVDIKKIERNNTDVYRLDVN